MTKRDYDYARKRILPKDEYRDIMEFTSQFWGRRGGGKSWVDQGMGCIMLGKRRILTLLFESLIVSKMVNVDAELTKGHAEEMLHTTHPRIQI